MIVYENLPPAVCDSLQISLSHVHCNNFISGNSTCSACCKACFDGVCVSVCRHNMLISISGPCVGTECSDVCIDVCVGVDLDNGEPANRVNFNIGHT